MPSSSFVATVMTAVTRGSEIGARRSKKCSRMAGWLGPPPMAIRVVSDLDISDTRSPLTLKLAKA